MTCRKLLPQWYVNKGNGHTSETVLITWMLYENWNSLRIHKLDNLDTTKGGIPKLVHDLSVESVF